MTENGYLRLASHQALHEQLYCSVFAFNEKPSLEMARVDAKMLRLLKTWLLDHVLKGDMDIEDFLKCKTIQAQKAARKNAQANDLPAADAAAATT